MVLRIIIITSIMAIFIIPIIILTFTDIWYEKDTGSWNQTVGTGFGLRGHKGETINNKGYKRYTGFCLSLFAVSTLLPILWGISASDNTTLTSGQIFVNSTMFIVVGYLISSILLFSSYKEKYINRTTSTAPRSHAIAVKVFSFMLFWSILYLTIYYIFY